MPGGSGPLADLGAPAVDVPTAKEFIDEVHRRVTREELIAIVRELELKASGFRSRLGREAIDRLTADSLREVLRSVFATRRRASQAMGSRMDGELRAWVGDLLYGTRPLAVRFDAFCESTDIEPHHSYELAAELLHFTQPERYWLWSRWIWNPVSRTGALPLVVSEEFDLEVDDGPGATYERVGMAMTCVDGSPEAASFRPEGGGRLGSDVFLVAVYGVYMSTVLGLKMSQEFNAIVPPIPQLARRLLGTHRMEV